MLCWPYIINYVICMTSAALHTIINFYDVSTWPPNLSFFCMMKCVMGRPPSSMGLFHLRVTDLLSKSTIPGSRGSLGGSAKARGVMQSRSLTLWITQGFYETQTGEREQHRVMCSSYRWTTRDDVHLKLYNSKQHMALKLGCPNFALKKISLRSET